MSLYNRIVAIVLIYAIALSVVIPVTYKCKEPIVVTEKEVEVVFVEVTKEVEVTTDADLCLLELTNMISMDDKIEVIKSYKKICEKYDCIEYKDIRDKFTEDELELFQMVVRDECGYESFESKVNVANVILNRVKSDKYPDTLMDVLKQSGQFGGVMTGSAYNADISDEEIMLAIEYAYVMGDTTSGAVKFNTSPQGGSHCLTDDIGHMFYR